MGKKKATGMSKRLGFTDRATINENKDILRYNERLEREAQGLPPEEPRRRAPRPGGRPDSRTQAGSAPGTRPESGPRRPPRQARPARPPALDEEQTAILVSAYRAVVGESGLEPAADKVIERISAHDGFERATMAGWDVAAGAHAEERTAQEWELLRTAWLGVRLALLEAYATFKPEAAEALAREQKQQARLAKPPRPRRRPGKGADKRRSSAPRPASAPRAPSPADVARHVTAHGSAPEETAVAASADAPAGPAAETASGTEPSPETLPPGVQPPPDGSSGTEPSPELPPALDVDAAPAVETPPVAAPEPHPVVREPEPSPEPAAAWPAAEGGTDVEPPAEPDGDARADDPEQAQVPEHEAYAAQSARPLPDDPDDGQLSLDL